MPRSTHIALLATLLMGGCAGDRPPDAGVLVGAAASLSGLLPELTAAYERDRGEAAVGTLGSSGQLAQQIRQGAPIAVFLSADARWVDALIAEGRIAARSRVVYARGGLVLWSRDEASAVARIEDLADPSVRRIAIANPETAPYGRAAREALVSAGVWRTVQERIIIAENVRQALQFAQTGNVDVAIVASTLVSGTVGHATPVPASFHAPIEHALGIAVDADTAAAARFVAFVLGPQGRAILERHGLDVDVDEKP